jgi:hypothetical protein
VIVRSPDYGQIMATTSSIFCRLYLIKVYVFIDERFVYRPFVNGAV